VIVRPMTPDDWEQVASAYREGIATGNATFETDVPSWEDWNAGHLAAGRLVADGDEALLGWAALSPVSDRCAYAGVAEASVYVAASSRGRGIGRKLLDETIRASEDAGIWTLQAGVFPENEASLALLAACGFCVVGTRQRLGHMNGVWRDVILLERRSSVVGV